MAINMRIHQSPNEGNRLKGSYANGNAPAATDPTALPLATWPTNFTYAGAFRVPINVTGSKLAYSDGIIGLSPTAGNMYMSLHDTTDKGIAEIQIPALSTSGTIGDLSTATEVQGRLDVFNTPDGNPQNNDKITGLFSHNNKLIVNLAEFYDAPADNTLTATVVDGVSNFGTASLSNQAAIQGAYKSSGWISEVPTEWQAALGYEHIIGNTSNFAIYTRSSVGPSAYGINLDDLTAGAVPASVNTEVFQSYSITDGQQLQQQVNPTWDLNNTSLANDVFSYTSKAGFGFIVPGTRTYAVFGSTCGLASGVGYKITQDNSNVCAGYCPATASDWTFFYWLFDVNDWLAVKSGSKQPWEIAPYEYGPLDTPLELNRGTEVGDNGLRIYGGAFDATVGRLYLSASDNDQASAYSTTPLVYAFDIGGL